MHILVGGPEEPMIQAKIPRIILRHSDALEPKQPQNSGSVPRRLLLLLTLVDQIFFAVKKSEIFSSP
jgi:hypothetical protein